MVCWREYRRPVRRPCHLRLRDGRKTNGAGDIDLFLLASGDWRILQGFGQIRWPRREEKERSGEVAKLD